MALKWVQSCWLVVKILQIEYTKLEREEVLVNWGSGYGDFGRKIGGQSGGGHSFHSGNWVWHRGAFGPRGGLCCYLLPQAGACSPLFLCIVFFIFRICKGSGWASLCLWNRPNPRSSFQLFHRKIWLTLWISVMVDRLVYVKLNIRNSGGPFLFFTFLMCFVCNLSLYKNATQMYRIVSYSMLMILSEFVPCMSIIVVCP